MAKSSHARIAENKSDNLRNVERFRGSSDIPLTSEGVAKGRKLASDLSKSVHVDRIITSNLGRASKLADMISNITGAPIEYKGDGLQSWAQGHLEGQPVTEAALDHLDNLIQNKPNEKLSGKGPYSTRPGESFNQAATRITGFGKQMIDRMRKNPNETTVATTHRGFIKFLKSWIDNGAPDSGSLNRKMMAHDYKCDDLPPGSIERIVLNKDSKPVIEPAKLGEKMKGGGVILARHEDTVWNNPRGISRSQS